MSSMERGGALGLLCVCVIAVGVSCASEESDLFAEGGSRTSGGRSSSGEAGAPGEKGGDTSLGGSLSGGAPPSSSGSGGSAACDDGKLCTTDSVGEDGVCVFEWVRCATEDPCQLASCDPATGSCTSSPSPDGAICDDGNACTIEDRCISGVCGGSSPLVLSSDVQLEIPDGLSDCGGIRELASATWTTAEAGQVVTLRLEIDVVHPYASDLEFVLRHEPSGNEAVILSRPGTPGAALNGTYGFEDGAEAFAGFEDVSVQPATFDPEQPLNQNFVATPVAGTWTLSAGDHCARDTGTLRAVRLTVERTCQ